MERSTTEIDTRHEAIKAMAGALADAGYTRNDSAESVTPNDAMDAASAMIKRYADLGDMGSAFEFITEASSATDKGFIGDLTGFMDYGDRSDAFTLADCMTTRARWYGESFLPEALDMLDSRSEIARDRAVDMAIDERKAEGL